MQGISNISNSKYQTTVLQKMQWLHFPLLVINCVSVVPTLDGCVNFVFFATFATK